MTKPYFKTEKIDYIKLNEVSKKVKKIKNTQRKIKKVEDDKI